MGTLSIINKQNASVTMSSREIAELVGLRHDNVKRTIETLANKLVITLPQIEEKATGGRPSLEYIFVGEQGRRDSIIVVAQLSPEFTAVIVDRWQELERQQKQTALLPDFTNPAESARAWAEQYEKRELAEQKLIAAQPKVAFVNHYVDVGTSKSLREVAKILKMPERVMISRLIEDKLLYRQSNNLLPYQSAHARDLFTVKTGTAEHGHNFTQTRVTSKGIEFIASRYASELML